MGWHASAMCLIDFPEKQEATWRIVSCSEKQCVSTVVSLPANTVAPYQLPQRRRAMGIAIAGSAKYGDPA